MDTAEKKRKFKFPDTYVVIFLMVVVSAVLTWIIPAGSYERTTNEEGRTVIVDGTYEQAEENSPVGIVGVFYAIEQGMVETADIIFFIMFAYGFVHMLIKNGTFDGLMGAVIRKTRGMNAMWLFALIMVIFGILGSTMGMAEETYGMYPIFIMIGAAMGYDAIVGVSLVYIGVETGFASATLNPFTVGVANAISEISMTKEMLIYRIICFVIFEGVGIAYVARYAAKIKKDPTKSLLYGTKYQNLGLDKTREEMELAPVTTRHKLCGICFVVTIGLMVWGVLAKGWYIDELSTLFFIAMVVVGFVGGFSADEIAVNFIEGAKSMLYGALIVGFSRGILVVLENGNIIDTILHFFATSLSGSSGVLSGIFQVIVQNFINFFIPSGSGQAATTMPIMAPLSDLLGISRQVAVLAETFGDGYSNMFIPTGVFTLCGIAGLPVDKWYKYIGKLFAIYFVLELVLISVAILIGL
ncbi:MAG: YfcC family protein [Oscillospiraceae bacterium]|jgi:uncharacterized ion transporter superfamily protein YfcC